MSSRVVGRSDGYRPDWYEWARSTGLIDDLDAVFRAPYLDPDSDDYPELLHIALRAWEETRAGGDGTPKQRIERFLLERHPLQSRLRRHFPDLRSMHRPRPSGFETLTFTFDKAL